MARTVKICWLLAVAVVAMAAVPGSADALRVTRSVGTDLSFSGDSCGQQVAASYRLPRRSYAVKLTRAPQVGEGLRDFATGGIVARVTSRQIVKSGGRYFIRITGTGSDDVCANPDSYLAGWGTDDFTVRARLRQRVRVYVSSQVPDVSQRHPRRFTFGAHTVISKLRWRWRDSKVARARGIFNFEDCIPSCAEGTSRPFPVKLRLSKPRLCDDGRYKYTFVRYRYLGRKPGQARRAEKFSIKSYCLT